MSKRKREEDARILAEMEAAMRERAGEAEAPVESAPERGYGENVPEKLHCKRCKSVLQDGVCPVCGYRVYMPMDEQKRKRIRLIVASVCIVGFLILFFLVK
ncbi:MAG: hypothetical protein IJ514_07285 [Clostridia bacterium]|nr:hypothetical protein [Clostridia bacterium]